MASAPTLINSVEVNEITASKITAGTIGAHEIILTQPGTQTSYAPPSSTAVLRSSNYSVGTAGWLIRGDGLAEFNDLTVRSRLDIGGDDASSFHVDNDGNMWLGAGISGYSTAPFRVSNTGALVATGVSISGAITATSGTFTGTVSGSTISGGSININSGTFSVTSTGALTATNANITGIVQASSGNIAGINMSGGILYTGVGNWANSNTGFYLDQNGFFSLKDKFYWNPNTNVATFKGALEGASGSVTTNFSIGTGCTIGGSLSIGDNVRVNGATGDGGATVFKVRGATSSSTTNFIAKFQNNAPDDIMSIRDDGLVDVSASFRYKGQVYSMASDGYAQFGAVGAPGSVGGRVFRINQAETLWDRSLSTTGSRPVYVNSDSTLFCGATVSSLRYKNNITNSVIDTKSFLELDVVDFYYNDEFYEDPLKKTKELGVIAEQVHEKGLIDLVRYDNEGRPDGLNENKIPFYLLKACIDQQKKIDQLELRLHSLENM